MRALGFFSLLLLLLAGGAPAKADPPGGQPGEVDPQPAAQRKVEVERRALEAVKPILASVCGGRCELVGVEAEVKSIRRVRDEMPGFEQFSTQEVDVQVERLLVRLAVDSKLSADTKEGLVQLVQGSLSSLTADVDIKVQTFEWPMLRSEPPPAPVVLAVPSTPDKESPAAPPQAPQPLGQPPPPPPTPQERLLAAGAEAAPWIGGLLLAVLLAFLLAKTLQRGPSLSPVADAAERTGAGLAGFGPGTTQLDPREESPLLQACLKNQSLRLRVLRQALVHRPAQEAAHFLHFLELGSLSEFHGSLHSDRLQEVYRAYRQLQPPQGTERRERLLALESLILEEMSTATGNGHLDLVYTLEPEVFCFIADSLPEKDRPALLLVAPEDLREAYWQQTGSAQRDAFLQGIWTTIGSQEEALARIAPAVERLAADANQERRWVLLAASALSRSLERLPEVAQNELLRRLREQSPQWRDTIAAEVVSESDLLKASDDAIEKLMFKVPPEVLVLFIRFADQNLKKRLEAKLPRYLRALYDAEQQRPATDEEVSSARGRVHRVWKTLAQPAGRVERRGS